LMAKLDILAQLHQQLGEQKIDLAIYPDLSRPFARLAVEDGAALLMPARAGTSCFDAQRHRTVIPAWGKPESCHQGQQ